MKLVTMSLEEFEKHMDSNFIVRQTYIVRIRQRYSDSIDNRWEYTNELFTWENGDHGIYDWFWDNDWNEGQDEIEILGCVGLDDLQIPNVFPEEWGR